MAAINDGEVGIGCVPGDCPECEDKQDNDDDQLVDCDDPDCFAFCKR
jgi:hypothetical protein